MKIFGFFYSKKVIFYSNKKNFIITQQGGGLAILTIRDDNRGFGTGRAHLNSNHLFFSILKLVPFKKLNGAGRGRLAGMRKFPNPPHIHFIFVFIFNTLIFSFLCYIKINIFHKK